MSKSRFLHLTLRFMVAFALLLVGMAGLFTGSANAAPLGTVPGYSVTIPAGGTGTIEVSGISLQPGSTLSSATLGVASPALAADGVRTALFYGVDWGYTTSAPDQVAMAVWWMQNSTWSSTDHSTAQRITDAASASAGTPSWLPDGRSILTIVQSGQATFAPLTLTPSASNASIGSGTLQITNTGINSITVYLPYGTLFTSASGQVLVWASGTGTTLPTPSATSQAVATATAVPATSTPSPVLPTSTQPSRKGGLAQPTATATVEQQEPTATLTARPKINPTSVPPTDTATQLPTATATATATETPTDVPTATAVVPTATPVPPTSAPTQELGSQEVKAVPPTQAPDSQKQAQAPKPNTNNSGTGATTPPTNSSQDNSSASTGTDVQANAVAGGTNSQTENSVSGPPLPAATTVPPSSGDGGDSAVPPPVGTATSASVPTISVPDGVSTIQAPATTPTIPLAQTTSQVPIAVPSGVVAIPTGVPTGAVPVATVTPTPTVPEEKPTPGPPSTPTPTTAPPPAEALPPVTTNDGNGTVDTTTDGSGSTAGSKPTEVPAGGNTSSEGAPPTVNPVTGGGPSSLPIWLGAASVLMVLGGWMLRRAGRKVIAVEAEQE